MIAEIRFKNMFSFRDEAILSFEADRSKDMESYHVVELGGDVRLLKVAVIYGANASGKSNIIKVCDFIKSFHSCPEKFYHSVSCLGPSPSGTLVVRSV